LWKYQISLKTAESSSSTHGRRVIERAEQTLVSRPGKIWEGEGRMSEIDLEWLLKVMPPGEAKLYRVLIQLIPAPSAEAPNLARRQIKMEVLAKLTGFTKRWVIELLPRLEEKNLIRTEGGSGTVKWIWRLPLGVPRLGPTQLTQKRTTSPGKAKAPRVAAPQPKRRQETAPSPKTGADVNVAPPLEKPAETPERRQEVPMPSIPPDDPVPDNPVVPATMVIPPPPTAPADPTLAAAMVPPPPPSTAPGGPAAGKPVVPVATVTPAPSKAPRRPGTRQPSNAPRNGDTTAFNGTSDTSKTDPSGPAAKAGRPDRRPCGIRMFPSRHFRFDLVAEGAGRERTPVAHCSRNPLSEEASLRA